MSSTRLV
jgi:hypothetical protein